MSSLKTQSKLKTLTRPKAILVVLGLILGLFVGVAATSASAAEGNILPPFDVGQSWTICRGYGYASHTGTSTYGLDLTGAGCDNSAAGRTVRAPVGGTVYYYQPSYGNLCINKTGGGSYTLTHINSSVTSGKVTAGQVVGTVAAAQPNPNVAPRNNNVAHIHFQMWASNGCYGDAGIPFDSANGARICGAPNLTPNGPNGYNNGTWSGTSFTGAGCGTSNTPIPPPTPVRPSFQFDRFGDLGVLHQLDDGGFDAHVLYGSTGTPFQYNPTLARRFSGTDGWNWNEVKTSSGDYNGDGFVDIAAVHQLVDGGADVHVLWGGTGTPFVYPTTFVRRLSASDGWNWDKIKVESGKFQGDNFSDLAILHKIGDGGFDVHVLYGSAGTPFQYNPTLARRFSGTDGWNWDKLKTSSGDYNGDGFDDIAAVHELADGGADVHVLWGGTGTPFTYPTTIVRRLSASDGWNWSKMKLESGRFQADAYSDLAILHELGDGGFDTHVLYGSLGTPFQYNPTMARHFAAADGWIWSKIKTSTGDYNGDDLDDVAVVHELADGGADVHVLWGGVGTPFAYPTTFVRRLAATDGWNWSEMKLEGR